jgi:DNA-binding response OmpR family regulator
MKIFNRNRDTGTQDEDGRTNLHGEHGRALQGDTLQGDTWPSPRRTRLLVVDENATALAVMGRRLSHMRYDVGLAENGFVALNMLLARQFDLVIIDMGMKMLSGVATMKKMRTSGMLGDASIMMVTARSDSAAMVEALTAGADDHIVKPFDFGALDARIHHVVMRARRIGELARHNALLDARIARRAMELGETRAALEDLQADRARLVSSIQALHDEVERLNVANGAGA